SHLLNATPCLVESTTGCPRSSTVSPLKLSERKCPICYCCLSTCLQLRQFPERQVARDCVRPEIRCHRKKQRCQFHHSRKARRNTNQHLDRKATGQGIGTSCATAHLPTAKRCGHRRHPIAPSRLAFS